RYITYLLSDADASVVGARLHRDGVKLLHVFAWLRVYIEGRSIVSERRRHGKQHRKIVNKGVRDYGLSPDVGRWLLDRGDVAHSPAGFSRVHNLDSLLYTHIYLEVCTRRRVSMTELAELVNATNYALGRGKSIPVDPVELGRELRRHRQRHAKFIKSLKADIASKL